MCSVEVDYNAMFGHAAAFYTTNPVSEEEGIAVIHR